MFDYEEYERKRRNSSNPKWHRTSEERDEKLKFSLANRSKISKYEADIYNDGRPYDNTLSIDERIEACDNSIRAFYILKDFCYQTYGGKIYFQDMWEYCHNSKNECFSFVDHLEKELEKLKKNRNSAIMYDNLENDLYETLSLSQPIAQAELLKYYPDDLKTNIRQILKEWESYDAIKRTKYKNTYIIELVE